MPTIFRYKGFRFHFFSDEGTEPPHVHVRRAEDTCKFWLNPIELAYNEGMRTHEIKELQTVIVEHQGEFLRKWHDYFP